MIWVASSQSKGFTLIEVLVTLLILAVGLLGLAGMNARVLNGQFEAYQRAQAMMLVEDMASRIRSNSVDARDGDYGSDSEDDVFGLAAEDCSAVTGVDLDLCEWNQALLGASTVEGTRQLGSILGARGCIENISTGATEQAVIRVTVAWQGLAPTVAPALSCGKDEYGDDDRLRRAVSVDVVLAYLGM
ncbi:type IV pilus assembly protein PilV [Azotobacter beijerinckii]|uniref:Type IV pilus assembly protein PilV n=1 Tax=Azotobacter beijerinckii TaxID=170623 RepID=A0A1H6QZ79_9GAMM|nr:type IV pilus modification protein PilV [Azotobacter beijerinckii]SEI48919.1 type IV pilus assembly protein PilV [Azotobacter beijerinckii]